jgi:hypothetical protein
MKTRSLSKSKYLSGQQCDKLLWTSYNDKDALPEVSAATQVIFDQGHEVGALAKQLYPDGIEIEGDPKDFAQTLVTTRDLLAKRKPLFEAAFSANDGYCRVDVLKPVGKDQWDIIEVKSTTAVKEVHREDLAFQVWVLAGAGLKIRNCYLCHINSKFVRSGAIDPRQYFVLENETARVMPIVSKVAARVRAMSTTIAQSTCPTVMIGKHCRDPYDCPLIEQCWSFLPEASVFTLYHDGKKGYELLNQGIHRLADIPDEYPLSENQKIQRRTLRTGKPHVDAEAIKAFLDNLVYPVAYFDFETVGPAIPLFDGSSPYKQVPFQYSMHVIQQPGAKPEHFEFLAEG